MKQRVPIAIPHGTLKQVVSDETKQTLYVTPGTAKAIYKKLKPICETKTSTKK